MFIDWGLDDNGHEAIWLENEVAEDWDNHPVPEFNPPLKNNGVYLVDADLDWSQSPGPLIFHVKHIYATMTLAGVELTENINQSTKISI